MKSFWRDQRGNVALIFGIAVLPLVLSVGAAVDYSRAASAENHLQEIVDAAALAGARENTDNLRQVTEAARAYFDSHLPPGFLSEVTGFEVSFTEDQAVRVEVDGSVETTFAGLAGIDHVGVKVASEVVRGVKGTLEVAFVLDTTGSMQENNKIGTLKKVTRKIVDEVGKYKDVEARYALVPFAEYVNVGLSRRSESWINVPVDRSGTEEVCWDHRPVKSKTGCRTVTETRYKDGVPHDVRYEKCDSVQYGDAERKCEMRRWSSQWHGCVKSRPYPLNTLDEDYEVRIQGIMDRTCSTEIQPLTDHDGSIKSAIARMKAEGNTYIPAGLIWGWRMLSEQEPFNEGKPYDPDNVDPRKIIVLLTDGDNTLGMEVNGDHTTAADGPQSDRYVTEICENVKEEKIEIYAVAFDVTDVGIKQVLQGCASGETHYFDAGSPKELEAAFDEIAASFLDLRISR